METCLLNCSVSLLMISLFIDLLAMAEGLNSSSCSSSPRSDFDPPDVPVRRKSLMGPQTSMRPLNAEGSWGLNSMINSGQLGEGSLPQKSHNYKHF